MSTIIYVLIIMSHGGADGGRAIDTSQQFISFEECKMAAMDIRANTLDRFPPTLACIKRTRVP